MMTEDPMTKPAALDRVRVASPCKADWNQMTGDDKVRHCAQCRLNVYNLSGMSREEAESLIQAKEGKLCVRFFQRADGTVLTRDCPVGFARVQRRLAAIAAVALGVCATITAGLTKLFGEGAAPRPTPQVHVADPTPPDPKPIDPPFMGKMVMGEAIAPQQPPQQEKQAK